ncbi:MAG: M48 family metalloprotease, partial [Alphaproteobacteria bacterium]|nr:M48 family metalloprotease [Alphaproteobacteria bacterium]
MPINRNKIFIVQDNNLNAFISDGNNLFINTGTIIAADNRNELSGVIAHEVGHIAGGHILRNKIQAQELQRVELASLILASAAAVAGRRADAAVAVMLGGQSSLLNAYTSFRLTQERSADEAALKYLAITRESPVGMLNFMKKIQTQNKMTGNEENPYFRTHPLTIERINFIEEAVKNSKYKPIFVQDDELYRIKAKLTGFLMEPEETYRKYPNSDNSIAAQ